MPNLTSNTEAVEADPVSGLLARWQRVVLALVLLLVFAYVGRKHFGELDRLREVGPIYVLGIVALALVARWFNSELLYKALHAIGLHIGRVEVFMLTILRTYAGLLIPKAGSGVTAVYLKVKHGVAIADFGALLLPIVLAQCFVVGVLGLGCQALLTYQYGHQFSPAIAAAFLVSIAVAVVASLTPLVVPENWPGRIARFARRFAQAWKKLSRDRSLLLRLMLLNIPIIFLRAARLQLAFWALGITTNFVGVLIASLLADLVFLISLTPQALGFREAAIVYSASVTGATAGASLAVAILDRLIVTLTIVVVAQFGLWQLPRWQNPVSQNSESGDEQTKD